MVLTQEELEKKIQSRFPTLSRRLQQVAHYIIEKPNSIAFGTAASIAEDAGVHASTLVRFAHAFDFEGFSEMQQLFKNKLLETSPDYKSRMQSVLEDPVLSRDSSHKGLLQEICNANASALRSMYDKISAEDLEVAIQLLKPANIIHVLGARRSFPVVTYFNYLLSNMGRRSHLMDGVGFMSACQQNLMSKQDVLFVVSFHPYSSETWSVVEFAREQQIPIVALTDSKLSPLAEASNSCIEIKEAEIHSFRSLSSSMNLVQALALSLIDK